jgi:hypothetical protein
LILFGETGLARETEQSVARHLEACDFCGAELQMLSAHWRRDLPALRLPAEMSNNLRRLADDLMAEPSLDRARLAETLCEIDRLTLTDAA